MSVDMTLYLWQILWAFLSGIFIGIFAIFLRIKTVSSKMENGIQRSKEKLNEIFGISKRIHKGQRKNTVNRIGKIAADLFFGVSLGAFLTVFAYATNDGILRWFSLLTGATSFILTLFLLNGPLTAGITLLFHLLKCIVHLSLKILLKPCRIIVGYLSHLFLPIYRKCILIFLCIRDKIKTVYRKSETKRNLRTFKNRINKDIILWQKK